MGSGGGNRRLTTGLAGMAAVAALPGLADAHGTTTGVRTIRATTGATAVAATTTPIQHVVVIFQENVSFDHYFGTYPLAANTSGQPFWAEHHVPDINKGKFSTPPAPDQGLCNAVHPVGPAVGGTGGTAPGGTNYGSKDDYIAHHAPFQYNAAS